MIRLTTAVAVLAAIVGLVGCGYGAEKNLMAVSTYNYTDNSLYDIFIQSAERKFTVESAANGGSVFSDLADKGSLPSGKEYFFKKDICCFAISGQVAPSEVRIVWNVVYDLPKFRQGEQPVYDKRSKKRAPAGSKWCTAVIKLRGVVNKKTNKLALHFLQDGAVVGVVGSDEVDQPLNGKEISVHSSNLNKNSVCKAEIQNPWFGSLPKQHME